MAPLALGGVLTLLAACGEELDEATQEDDSGTGRESATADDTIASSGKDAWPDTISYGLLPTGEGERLATIYTPFEEYMAACLDHPFELFEGTNYTAMIEAMRTGEIHVSKFGPFSYILANERAGAEALVQPLEDANEPYYWSYIITLESAGFETLEDLEGESFAFVDPASSSGYLFPRAMLLNELGISNDEVDNWFSEVVFSGGHDASIVSVLNQDVAGAAISSNAWVNVEQGQFDEHENVDDLTILAESEDIPRTVEAIAGDLPQDLKDAVESCYTSAIDDQALQDYFVEINALAGYHPVDDSAYDVVRDTAAALGLSPEELLDE